MSANAHAHDAHGAHGHGGADHVPHVLPLTHYFKTYGALLVLTVITVGASYVNLGTMVNLLIALAIATIKATVVALIFMHLYWDQKFFSIIFASSVLFLAIFLAFTMFDTNARGIADPYEAEKPADYKVPFGGTQSDVHLKKEADKSKLAAEEAAKKMVPTYKPSPAAAAPAAAGAEAGQPTAPAGVAPATTGTAPTPEPSIPAPAGLAPGSVPPRADEAKPAAPALPPAPSPAPR